MKAITLVLLFPLFAAAAEPLRTEGEVIARRKTVIIPPEIENVGQLVVSQIAPNGQAIKKGDLAVAFQDQQVAQELSTKQNELNEKQSLQKKLALEVPESLRTASLATAKAYAALVKAQRKTDIKTSAQFLPGLEFKKLLIARTFAERAYALAQQHEKLSAELVTTSQRLVDADVERLSAEIDRLNKALASLQIKASADGVLLHNNDAVGNKIDVGSQIFRGQSVANIPDMTSLAVRVSLPERDYTRVAIDSPVRVRVEGSADAGLPGRVSSIGRAVQSKSKLEPVPVVALEVTLEDAKADLRPGQAVRVEILPLDRQARP